MLRFWRNGFSVDNGPLRDFHDPENLEFLEDVRRGLVFAAHRFGVVVVVVMMMMMMMMMIVIGYGYCNESVI